MSQRNKCFIFGSGRSLLSLTRQERDYLSSQPHTLAMNRYLLFWQKVGVIPKALFVADTHYPSHRIVAESITIAKRLPLRPHFYLNQYYRRLLRLPYGPKSCFRLASQWLTMWRESGYAYPCWRRYSPVSFFISDNKYKPFFWATDLSQQLYFYRGSLTTAINLAAIIYPGTDIYLLGVDLGSPDSFFQEELANRPDLRDKSYDPLAEKGGRHFTALPFQKLGPITKAFPAVAKRLQEDGRRLFCTNRESLLVTEGVCDYAPLMEPEVAASSVAL